MNILICLVAWAEAAVLEELDNCKIYWPTSLFKCIMLSLDSHILTACAKKNAMSFSGQLNCLCGRTVQKGLGNPASWMWFSV